MANGREVATRREFLQRGLILAACAGTVPSFLCRAAEAMDDKEGTEARRGGKDLPTLVVVQLAGGNDTLNTLVPYGDDAYYRVRPTIGVKADDVLRIDDHLGLHPNLAPLKALYDEGLVGLVQGVGYPNPNRSHFRSMEIWETASDSDRYERHGWIGRYFDNCCSGAPDDVFVGLRVGRNMPQSFSNGSSLGISLQEPEQYKWNGDLAGDAAVEVFRTLNSPTDGAQSPLDFLQRTALNANLTSDRILELASHHRDTVDYPGTPFANSLKTVAQLIAGGLPTRVYYATLGGFDTHANELNTHPGLMTTLAEGLSSFVRDLKDQGNLERVLVMGFSEFGRRVAENFSGGTDHGSAGLMFLAGGPALPGIHGETPSLTDLSQGDLKYHLDFRSVYATVLDGWLETDSSKVLGRAFDKLPLLRG